MALVKRDSVANLVTDYGRLQTKIVSLAQLRMIDGGRAELAMLSLARSYIRRCTQRGGKWTSGVHLAWWTRQRLADDPAFGIEDLLFELPVPVKRQLEIARWSTIMLRLLFLSDVGSHAPQAEKRIHSLASLAEDAAAATDAISPTILLKWIRQKAIPKFDRALSEKAYSKLCEELRADEDK
jgi:hypothetical protein